MTKSSKSTKIEKYRKNRKNSQKSIKIHKNRQKITKTKIVDFYLTRLTANICITHPTAGFEVFVNKKPTFNCSINDAGSHNFLEMRKKQQILYSLFSSKTSLLRTSDSISKKKMIDNK